MGVDPDECAVGQGKGNFRPFPGITTLRVFWGKSHYGNEQWNVGATNLIGLRCQTQGVKCKERAQT